MTNTDGKRDGVARFLKISLLLLLNIGMGGGLWLGWQAHLALSALHAETLQTLTSLRRSAESAEGLVATYRAEMESERSKKALAASLAAAASWQATARLVNTQLIPEAQAGLRELRRSSGELAELLRTQNGELSLTQAQSRATIAALQEQIEGLGPEISRLTTASALAVEATKGPIGNLERSSAELAKISQNLELASRSAPEMAKSLEQILATGGRWQRPVSLATLLIALIGALR